jgi:hypothetical protein
MLTELRAAERTRAESLRELLDVLAKAERDDVGRDNFSSVFALAVQILELDQESAARAFKTSRPTISRWMSGQSAPHRVGRPSVFRELSKIAKDRLRQHT